MEMPVLPIILIFTAIVVIGFDLWYLIDIKRGRAEWDTREFLIFNVVAYVVILVIILVSFLLSMGIWWVFNH
jgi:hypothetical protein